MPEGPEIRRAADKITNAILAKPIVRILFGLAKLKAWEAQLAGTAVNDVETYGKAILIRLDNALNIYSHNQLYGCWIISPNGELPNIKRQLRIAIHTQDQSALLYSASDIEVLHDSEIQTHPYLKKLGPDILSPNLTKQEVVDRLISKRFVKRQLGAFLTDQSFVAGLGNYLRCEILFVTGLNPKVLPSQLSNEQLNALAHAILDVPKQSYETAGITNDLEQAEALIKQGYSFEDARFWVFRRKGQPCYRCKTIIKKQISGGQNCYFCPTCQN